jgi:hypothetical protein
MWNKHGIVLLYEILLFFFVQNKLKEKKTINMINKINTLNNTYKFKKTIKKKKLYFCFFRVLLNFFINNFLKIIFFYIKI